MSVSVFLSVTLALSAILIAFETYNALVLAPFGK